jgi:hypothetical protein
MPETSTSRRSSIPALLVMSGAGFLGCVVALVLAASGPGKTTTTTDAPPITTTSSSSSTPTGSTSTSATVTAETKAGYARTTVTVRPSSQPVGSDTLDVALLGIGIVLVLSGAFYARLTEVDFPGGGGLKLGPVASAKLAQKAAATAGSDKREQRRLIQQTLIELDKNYWGAPAEPDPEVLDQALSDAVTHLA